MAIKKRLLMIAGVVALVLAVPRLFRVARCDRVLLRRLPGILHSLACLVPSPARPGRRLSSSIVGTLGVFRAGMDAG